MVGASRAGDTADFNGPASRVTLFEVPSTSTRFETGALNSITSVDLSLSGSIVTRVTPASAAASDLPNARTIARVTTAPFSRELVGFTTV